VCVWRNLIASWRALGHYALEARVLRYALNAGGLFKRLFETLHCTLP
jgi:hypothetical protein